jgi:CSLREA domain-containing protein
LIGNLPGDAVGSGAIALTNGHYVVSSPSWNNGGLADVGAVTWCDGTTGRKGFVTASNSLVGTQLADAIGRSVVPLANGNYVAGSDIWDNGSTVDAGGLSWCDGTIGCAGPMSAAKSLVGSGDTDRVGSDGVAALTNGNYVVGSSLWGNTDLGAVTWCEGTSGRIGTVSAANSLIGSHPADRLGTPVALSDGNYYVRSEYWDHGATTEAGAITLGRGDIGVVGEIDAANSVRGSFPNEGFGLAVDYNAVTGQLVVGKRIQNIVSLFATRGPDFTVTTVDDHNDGTCSASDCTLREAILAANAQPDDNTIRFAPGLTGIIQLTGGLPNVTGNTTLQGPGANLLTVRRNTATIYRVFSITNGSGVGPVVTISGLTISNGLAPGSGGGIQNDHGTLIVRECVLTENRGELSGTEPSYGGAIYNWGGSLTVEASTIAGNTAVNGGGIASMRTASGTSVVTIRRSTISGNTANGGSGGGIYNEANGPDEVADVTVTNSTLSGNSATPAGFFGGAGGAIYNFGRTSGAVHVSFQDCTISDNNAPSAGSIYNRSFSATAVLTLRNTILKTGTTGSNFINADGSINSLGNNLCNDDAAAGDAGTGPGGHLSGPGDIRNTDPLLGPLQDNGGPTQTHALLNGSPAINAGVTSSETSKDQRGYPRRATNDIGAFESGVATLRIRKIARNNSDVVVTFDVSSNVSYRLERKLALPDATWQSIPGANPFTSQGEGSAQITDPGAANLGRAFYRVEMLVP